MSIRTLNRASFKHVEAFCLMKYATDDGSEIEWIWNSRDGVTPFCILNRARTKEMRHVGWQFDRFIPHYKPIKGERIFVDLTRERAEFFARERVERFWDHGEYPMRERYDSKEHAIQVLVDGMLQHNGAPDLIEVQA
jgi:hypothetical protein